jgi:hypothetical protein
MVLPCTATMLAGPACFSLTLAVTALKFSSSLLHYAPSEEYMGHIIGFFF